MQSIISIHPFPLYLWQQLTSDLDIGLCYFMLGCRDSRRLDNAGTLGQQTPREGLQHNWLNFDFFCIFLSFLIFFYKIISELT